MSRKGHKPRRRAPIGTLPTMQVNLEELSAILERAKPMLSAEDHAKLTTAMATLASTAQLVVELIAELQSKKTSVERLRRMLFGARTEKTEQVLGEERSGSEAHSEGGADSAPGATAARKKLPGHGRNGAAAYSGAAHIHVPHTGLAGGDGCPGCHHGKVYPLSPPAVLVRITGMAPLGARVYACDRLRCNLCGEVYSAAVPPGVGSEKYDASATGMVGLLRYGTGLPFNRIEQLQRAMRIPLPAATQWDLVERGAPKLAPGHEELIRQAAQGTVVHNDDTTMKILQLTSEQRAEALGADAAEGRTGVFTSGIVATGEGRKIALFFTGVRHAGENLAAVLERRAKELPIPIQMCDGSSSNTPEGFETLLSNCNAHGRRKFVELVELFPEEVRFVLETLREVYKTEARARKENLDPEQRLRLHQGESAPRMAALEQWMRRQLAEHRIEPNSRLGEAIRYLQKRWDALTLFLRVAAVPLDNNICEQALKKAIVHRKNSLFYRTLNGARVGDIFMSLIYTAELNGIAPFDYLLALLRHSEQLAEYPEQWMPWNYQATLARLGKGPDPPP
ncbi:MAG: IS66 family transposase [Steroidobacteraceae bacterium]